MTMEPLVRFTAHEMTRDELHALMTRSDGPALLRAASHLGALAVTGTLLWMSWATLWAVPLTIVHGYVLAFMFCAFHEAAHRTAFRTRWLNVALGTLAGLIVIWPYRNYRVYHWEHHRFTQDAARDPELYFPKPASLVAWLFVLTGIPNLHRRLVDLLRLAAGRADRPWMAPAERRPLIREARAYLTVYVGVIAAAILARSVSPLVLWLLPLLAGQVFLRPYLLAEHTGCSNTRDCLENTRTTLTLDLVRLFAWNMPYHAEHHAYPGVPFHALPRLHEHVRGRIEHLEPGYVAATVTVNRALFASPRSETVA
jgi:fatty acid desaturase